MTTIRRCNVDGCSVEQKPTGRLLTHTEVLQARDRLGYAPISTRNV